MNKKKKPKHSWNVQEVALQVSYTRCRADVCDFNERLDFVDRYPNLGDSTFFFLFCIECRCKQAKTEPDNLFISHPKYWSMLQIQQQFFRALICIHRTHKYGVEAKVSCVFIYRKCIQTMSFFFGVGSESSISDVSFYIITEVGELFDT